MEFSKQETFSDKAKKEGSFSDKAIMTFEGRDRTVETEEEVIEGMILNQAQASNPVSIPQLDLKDLDKFNS
jgi:hypothetical protein